VANAIQGTGESSALKVKAVFRTALHIPEGGDRQF
jgi:hypothetical protein